jgi:hypothetical protein
MHFVPQYYLRAFREPSKPDHIWTLVRGESVPRLLPIKQVAQARGFYDAETEVELAAQVEAPANPVLAKLRRGESIEPEERLAVAMYVATMVRRVPRNRARARELLPAVLDATVENLEREIEEVASRGKVSSEVVARRLSEIAAIREKYKLDPPELLKAQIRDPHATDAVFLPVLGMTWRILVAPAGECFITTDNPAFFFEGYGLGREESELRFPLSPTHALHGSWTTHEQGLLAFMEVTKDCVREFNRSLASGATKLAFSHCKAPWIATLLDRTKPYLSRLVWT